MTKQAALRETVAAIRERPKARVLIVGGGINGIAVFRELAANGIDVVLVERSDFVSGASAASSHMIHGGVRYLENGEFRLVRESVRERNALLRLAPHRVRPLETTIPIFSTFSGILAAPLRILRHGGASPTERGALLIKVGMLIYDTFSRDGGRVPRHRFRGRRRSLRAFAQLNPAVKYTATYFDASVADPERLAIDVLLDGLAAGDHGRAANYVTAVGASREGIRLRDEETGDEFDLQAELVVNASGPWTDLTNSALGTPTQLMGGTKGSHIVIDDPVLFAATGGREIFFENPDGRAVLIYPLKGRVLVGTTDLETDLRAPAVCTEDEVEYFLRLVGHVFPAIAVDRSSIVFRFSGVRPLPAHGDLRPGFVSRDYRIVETALAGGISSLSLVGGKWTTFRALGARLADEVLQRIGAVRTVDLSETPIGIALIPEETHAWLGELRGSQADARRAQLADRYGGRVIDVLESESAHGAWEIAGGQLSTGELRYLVESEHVTHVADIVLRRTDIAFRGAATPAMVSDLAHALGEVRGWHARRIVREAEECLLMLRERHGVGL